MMSHGSSKSTADKDIAQRPSALDWYHGVRGQALHFARSASTVHNV